MSDLAPVFLGGAVIVAVVVLIVWLPRAGGKLIAARRAKLMQLATGHGLSVKPSKDDFLFSAEGEAQGTPLRISIDQMQQHRGDGTRYVLRVVARSIAPRPAIVIGARRVLGGPGELATNLHELSTGDATFDERFMTSVEDDAPAKNLLAGIVPALLELGGGGLSGLESLKVGSEVALLVDTSLDSCFFEDGRVEKAVTFVFGLAGGAVGGYRT